MAPVFYWMTELILTGLLYTHTSDKMIHIIEYDSEIYESHIAANLDKKYTLTEFSEMEGMLVAINGGYHGYKKTDYGPLTKLAIDGDLLVPNNNMSVLKKYSLNEEHVNAILSIDATHHRVSIGSDEADSYIYSGPLLMENGVHTELNTKWDRAKNPRTIVCTRSSTVLFIVIDGRQEDALGMTLIETQILMDTIGCENAINMDGGGSASMFINGKGIVNIPRSVGNDGKYITIERSISSIVGIRN